MFRVSKSESHGTLVFPRSLIAVLSRDLREDFLPFVPPFLGACLRLLEGGADREPDVLEQIFTSVSYVFKHLVKYLAKDLTQALK